MSPGEDLTRWIKLLKAGEREAVQQLWQRYYQRLVALARQKLGRLPRRAADEEDVALSAFDSFIRRAEQGRFPRLEDRQDLWQLLVVLTRRKIVDHRDYEESARRDWRRIQHDAADGSLVRGLIGREPDPVLAAQVGEECRRLLAALPDEELRQIVLRKMEGYTNEEIAELLGIARATVGRRLTLIRKTWLSEADIEDGELFPTGHKSVRGAEGKRGEEQEDAPGKLPPPRGPHHAHLHETPAYHRPARGQDPRSADSPARRVDR
jgi:RNA polymerase sigma factor (sigma-70 family)